MNNKKQRTYVRVQRGMVFWFNPERVYGKPKNYIGYKGKTYKSSIQNDNRPWLVISNNKGNSSSPTCNIVPITLEDKTEIPVHVHFTYEGIPQTILCEQPKTVDIMALGEYMYTISDDLMRKVERAMAIQCGIRPSISMVDFTLDNTVQHLEEIVSKILEFKMSEMKEECKKSSIPVSQIEDAALHLGQMIEDLVGEEIKPMTNQPEPQKTTKEPEPIKQDKPVKLQLPHSVNPDKPNYSGMSAIDKFNARLEKSKQMNNHNIDQAISNSIGKLDISLDSHTPTKGKRNKWTAESRKAILEDCDRLSPQEVMKKYGFKSIQSVFQTKYQCKNALANLSKEKTI